MRQPRLTWPGAYHHCTNRGHNGEPILAGSGAKRGFLDFLGENAEKYRLRIFAWCLLDNHYHLVLQNESGRLSQFFRYLDAQFAVWYRSQMGGRGYVFQDRFHSTLIQDETYLKMAILYTLRNPVQAGLTREFGEYKWSSAGLYFARNAPAWLDTSFVEKLFHSREALAENIEFGMGTALPVLRTVFGPVLGSEDFQKSLLHIRKGKPGKKSSGAKTKSSFAPVGRVIREFEATQGVKISQLDLSTHVGKRLRSRLLVELKDRGGLTFGEIWKLPLFSTLTYRSLPHLCQRARGKIKIVISRPYR